MLKRTATSSVSILSTALLLTACVNTRLFSEQELSAVGRACGVAEGEVVQEEDAPRFLLLFTVAPSPGQLDCIKRWSRRRNMHLAYIDAIDG